MTRFASKLYSLLFLTLTLTSSTGYTFFGIPSTFLLKRSAPSVAMRLEVFRRHPISNPVPPHQASKTHCSSSTSLNYLNGDEAISANSSNNDKMNELSSDSYDMTTEIRVRDSMSFFVCFLRTLTRPT